MRGNDHLKPTIFPTLQLLSFVAILLPISGITPTALGTFPSHSVNTYWNLSEGNSVSPIFRVRSGTPVLRPPFQCVQVSLNRYCNTLRTITKNSDQPTLHRASAPHLILYKYSNYSFNTQIFTTILLYKLFRLSIRQKVLITLLSGTCKKHIISINL